MNSNFFVQLNEDDQHDALEEAWLMVRDYVRNGDLEIDANDQEAYQEAVTQAAEEIAETWVSLGRVKAQSAW